MHPDPFQSPATSAASEEEVPSIGIGALLAFVLFLLAASSYAQDTLEIPAVGPDGSPPPTILETPATADIPPEGMSSQNPLDTGTPAPTTSTDAAPAVEPAAAVAVPADAPPAPPPPAVDASVPVENGNPASSTTTVKAEKHHPEYQLHRPNFGLALSMSPTAGIAGATFAGADFESAMRSFQFQAEYQPAFLQAIGVLGIGACGTIYLPFKGPTTAPDPVAGITWSAGGQIRYQFRYWREQWVVPTVSFGAEYMVYDLGGTTAGSLMLMYPGFGGMLLLNFIEPSAAAEGWATSGVSRSYLWGEARFQIASGTEAASGILAVAGIRVEL